MFSAIYPYPPYPRYALIIRRLLRPHFRYLLNNFQYRPIDKFQGPPYAVPNYMVHQLFGQFAWIGYDR